MDVMSTVSLGAVSTDNVMRSVQISGFKGALDQMEQTGNQIAQMMQTVAPAIPSDSTIDIKI